MNFQSSFTTLFLTADDNLHDTVEDYFHSIGVSVDVKFISDLSSFSSDLQSKRYDITIADMNLGNVILEQAIAIHKSINKDLPFLVITEKNNQDDAARLINTGASDYITTDNLKRLYPAVSREIKWYRNAMSRKEERREIKELWNIIDSAEDEIYILNSDETIKYANRRALSNLGYKMDEISGMHIQRYAEKMVPLLCAPRGMDRQTSYYTRFIRKDGTRYPAKISFQNSESEGKMSILATVQDITEMELEKKQTLILNKAIEASSSAVTIADNEYKIVYTNKKQVELSGVEKSDMIGSCVLDQLGSNNDVISILKNCMNGESWVGEYSRRGADGEEYFVIGSVSPVFGDGCNVINIIIVEEDITEQVRFKNKLRHAQKMETVGELTSSIAHDFTNMLTAIGGFASIMKRKMDSDSRFYGYVERIVDLTVRAQSLTQNLLTFSRKQKQTERVINVNNLVDSVSGFLSMVIGNKLQISIKTTDEELNIMGNPILLEQVIINLATNARDAVGDDGELHISTDATMISDSANVTGFKEHAIITVRDNGCGIPEEKSREIFEPFFTTKEEGKGTGLGLYIVSDIVEKHSGTIECNSEIGVGTEFIIKIPLTDQEEIQPEEERIEEPEGVTILLAEDEKIVRESLVNALEAYGYKVLTAANGKELIETYSANRHSIDLIITDIVMPIMDGISAFREISKINRDIDVIFITGYVGELHKQEGFDESEHMIILKPLEIKKLVKAIEERLHQKN